MILPILEPTSAAALRHARDLGLAFQLTNFLRDVAEDLDRGRVYIPQDDLARFDADPRMRRVTPEWRGPLAFRVPPPPGHSQPPAPAVPLRPPPRAPRAPPPPPPLSANPVAAPTHAPTERPGSVPRAKPRGTGSWASTPARGGRWWLRCQPIATPWNTTRWVRVVTGSMTSSAAPASTTPVTTAPPRAGPR